MNFLIQEAKATALGKWPGWVSIPKLTFAVSKFTTELLYSVFAFCNIIILKRSHCRVDHVFPQE